MIERIINQLGKANINVYKVNMETVESVELFFIKKALDMNRKKKVTHYKVTVYKDFEEDEETYRGSSEVDIYPTMKDEEIEKILKDGLYAAGFVKNKFYPLVKGEKALEVTIPSKFSGFSLEEGAMIIQKALYKNDVFQQGGINSSEIFLNKSTKRIVNSEGVDVSFVKFSSEIECITQWIEDQDVELFNVFSYGDLDEQLIAESVKDAIELTKWRVRAKGAVKTGSYKVLLRKLALKEMFSYYTDKASVGAVYNKLSNFKPGEIVQGENILGDKVTITLKGSAPYDNDGLPLKEINLIEDGILKTYHGNTRFSHYLGIEPTGDLDEVVVKCGDKSMEEMKQEPYLELLAFSDFQMDSLTGNFAGEIRLGFYFDGENRTPVTGGSMSGNINNVQNRMFLSKEVYKDGRLTGPNMLELFNINIAGE
jgi:predicted Zn-dependent protease